MATITGTPEYSNFFGSPVVVTVTAGNYAGATFHRVRINVSVAGTEFVFSSPVSSDALTVSFDISSAFRAVADNHQYQASVLNVYPALTAMCVAYDDYMLDGQEYYGVGASEEISIGPVYAGALSDMERLQGLRYPATGRYSRKPTDSSPEIVYMGYQQLVPASCVTETVPQPPFVNVYDIDEQFVQAHGIELGIYAITPPKNGYELRFINSCGVHENVFVSGLPSKEVSISTEQYVISRQEALTQFSRGLALKQNDRETWHFSSPPLDKAWQSWYVHELLMARWLWLGIPSQSSTLYVPCHILPEETTRLFDRQKPDAMTVPFALQLDINGSPIL